MMIGQSFIRDQSLIGDQLGNLVNNKIGDQPLIKDPFWKKMTDKRLFRDEIDK